MIGQNPISLLTALLLLLFTTACRTLPKYDDPQGLLPRLHFEKVDQLKAALHQYALDRTALISAHRGGPSPGYPENCIQTIKQVHRQIPAIFEVDIEMTEDSILVLMHDKSLDRTTTGQGELMDQTWKDIRKLKLKDLNGTSTRFRIPRLSKTLRCFSHRTVLSLDIKRGVPFKKVLEMVEKYKAESSVMIIAYSIEDANTIHAIAPQVLISLGIYNTDDIDEINQKLKVPLDQIIAFTGTKIAPPSFYTQLRRLDIPIILGTLGDLDKQATKEGDSLYHTLHEKGIDIFATDRPIPASKALYSPQ